MNVLNTYQEFDYNQFDLNVDHYGSENCASNYAFGPSVRDDYVLHFITDGCGTLTVRGETTSLKAGDLFLLPKQEVTFYQADANKPWSYIWVGFSGPKANNILNRTQLMEKCFVHSNLDSPILEQMLGLVGYTKNLTAISDELNLTGELYHLLALLIQEFPAETSESDMVQHYVKRVLKIIHVHYGRQLKVCDIADQLNLNRSYLYKIFKEETGSSLKEYILHVKMDKSLELLANPQFNISEIARSVGFPDPLAFSKSFKKVFGTSPSRYRKELNHQE